MSFKNLLLKQYNMGMGLGMLKDSYGRAAAYQMPVTMFLALLTAYNTMMLRPELSHITQWFNFPLFVGIAVVSMLFLMLFVWKVEIPSSVKYVNKMAFQHHNLIKELIEGMEERQNKKHEVLLQKVAELNRLLDEKVS